MREELSDFVAAVEQVPELRELLRNPQLDPRARAAALEGGGQLDRQPALLDRGEPLELGPDLVDLASAALLDEQA